ncbi:NAD(P)/FAD-dependent oxidoreductase [Cupriavidus basilensis]
MAEIRPQARIALIDALEIGQGTSGRNAGFLIDVPHNVDGGQPDAEYERQLFALNNLAIGQLRSLKERYRIDCGWHDAGKYMSAHEEGNLARLECFADALKAAGFEYEVVEGQALSRRLGTSYYKAAVYTPGNVLVKPGGPGSRSGRCATGIRHAVHGEPGSGLRLRASPYPEVPGRHLAR